MHRRPRRIAAYTEPGLVSFPRVLDHRWREWPVYSYYVFPVDWIARLAIWFMVLLSLVSAGDYFIAFWSKIDRQAVKRRRRSFVLSRRRKRDVAAT